MVSIRAAPVALCRRTKEPRTLLVHGPGTSAPRSPLSLADRQRGKSRRPSSARRGRPRIHIFQDKVVCDIRWPRMPDAGRTRQPLLARCNRTATRVVGAQTLRGECPGHLDDVVQRHRGAVGRIRVHPASLARRSAKATVRSTRTARRIQVRSASRSAATPRRSRAASRRWPGRRRARSRTRRRRSTSAWSAFGDARTSSSISAKCRAGIERAVEAERGVAQPEQASRRDVAIVDALVEIHRPAQCRPEPLRSRLPGARGNRC